MYLFRVIIAQKVREITQTFLVLVVHTIKSSVCTMLLPATPARLDGFVKEEHPTPTVMAVYVQKVCLIYHRRADERFLLSDSCSAILCRTVRPSSV